MNELEPGYPCKLCGVRSDIACRHRQAETLRAPFPDRIDGRSLNTDGRGYAFRIAAARKAKLSAIERAWLLATPVLQEPMLAGHIALIAGIGSGQRFGAWASQRPDLFERVANTNNSYGYRLTEAGTRLRREIERNAN